MEIEVGTTFEVVEVLSTGRSFKNAFVKGRTTLKIEGEYVCNHEFYRRDFPRLPMLIPLNRLPLKDSEVKPIGRLRIKTLK